MSDARDEGRARSVRQRLMNLARSRGIDFNALLVQFVLERALYRLSRSAHADRFVLKGALLFRVWSDELRRPTLDIDLLGHGDASPDAMATIFREALAETDVPDGVAFDINDLVAGEIRGAQEYGGVRILSPAHVGTARVRTQIDVGFGDVVTPGPVPATLPALLDHPAPRLRVYPPETAIAEKLEAIVQLGMANSRMKDYYDILVILKSRKTADRTLGEAIHATFKLRGTPVPLGVPQGLTKQYAEDTDKAQQWAAFVGRVGVPLEMTSLTEVVEQIAALVRPALRAARSAD